MLVACIAERVKRMQTPPDLPALQDRQALASRWPTSDPGCCTS